MTDEWRTYDERRGWVAYRDTPARDPRRRILGYGLTSVLAAVLCGVGWAYAAMYNALGAALAGEESHAGLGSVLTFGAVPMLLACASLRAAAFARRLGRVTRLGLSLPALVTVAAVSYFAVLVERW